MFGVFVDNGGGGMVELENSFVFLFSTKRKEITMDGFPSAYAITERKKHELDDLIENLKNLIKTLIMIRYTDIEIIIYCTFGKFRIKRGKTHLTWDYLKSLDMQNDNVDKEAFDGEEDSDEIANKDNIFNKPIEQADKEIVKAITNILNQVDDAWGKSVEISYIFEEIRKDFAELGYTVESSSKKLKISWADKAYTQLKVINDRKQ